MSGAKKAARIFGCIIAVIVILAVLAVSAALCINGHMISDTRERIVSPEEAKKLGADCILVLGRASMPTAPPVSCWATGWITAVDLYSAGVSNRLLMSGDHGTESYDEVGTMKGAGVHAGVPSEDVFMDHAGFITYDSIYRARMCSARKSS